MSGSAMAIGFQTFIKSKELFFLSFSYLLCIISKCGPRKGIQRYHFQRGRII